MVRGRIGGTGMAFNLGEMTVTRASVRLATGEVGHAWVQGRDRGHALRAAAVDALMQTPAGPEVAEQVLMPLEAEVRTARDVRAAKAAGTKVDFFTMARGEDK
jgi:alpha-D-ribose 1-methylphosphonate 5-triphosphate synthase subunit PhnG